MYIYITEYLKVLEKCAHTFFCQLGHIECVVISIQSSVLLLFLLVLSKSFGGKELNQIFCTFQLNSEVVYLKQVYELTHCIS